jgi:hypothetical protein
MPAPRPPKTRLTNWKEVAAFFGKGERTVMRWEVERGLPVHRLPGEARSGIYADVAELEAWLRGGGTALAEAAETVPACIPPLADPLPPTAAASTRRWRFALPMAALAALLAFMLDYVSRPPTAQPPPPAAHDPLRARFPL